MNIKSASFTDRMGSVTYEDGTIEHMTYDEYIIKQRNFQYTSIAQLIRYLDRKSAFYSAGHKRSIERVTVFENRMEIFDLSDKDVMTNDEHKKVARLLLRYQRYCYYCKEILPQWREVDRINFADNSVEVVQINRYGEKRHVMVTAPHGDACY
ncbi:hypothetical protein [Paenibacillus sp. Mc5Re-14]|uniref:hypothetical protein n=1 Tax=Paenibacillus sp. Mc5Re-14 TaxID=1030529 RepID=UPI000B09CF30|nr:hypothetical protein [Paenibacillus sp. Mc5Re-14]